MPPGHLGCPLSTLYPWFLMGQLFKPKLLANESGGFALWYLQTKTAKESKTCPESYSKEMEKHFIGEEKRHLIMADHRWKEAHYKIESGMRPRLLPISALQS